MRKEDPTMFDVEDTLIRSQGKSVGDGRCIRLRAEHPSHHRAARFLASLGGSKCRTEQELVYGFVTTLARNEALLLVRCALGWSVAGRSHGRLSLPATRRRRV